MDIEKTSDLIADENIFFSFLKKRTLFSCIFLFCFLILFYLLAITSPNKFPSGVIQSISEGATLRSVSKMFKENKIIKSRAVFEALIIIFGNEKSLLPGDYLFENKMSVFKIAQRLREGDRYLVQIKLTIPEGFNIFEIAEITDLKLPKFNKDNFLKQARSLEGYLFPDTYFFFSTADEIEVLEYMTKNFENKFKDIRAEIIKQGKNEKEILTMASILEREARGDVDREYVSGILWKRLNIGMALQVDAWPVTYKERGLPDNPISNPGLKAIHAALYPKTTPYLYYLHDKEGMIHYARSFAEHKANIAKYLR